MHPLEDMSIHDRTSESPQGPYELPVLVEYGAQPPAIGNNPMQPMFGPIQPQHARLLLRSHHEKPKPSFSA